MLLCLQQKPHNARSEPPPIAGAMQGAEAIGVRLQCDVGHARHLAAKGSGLGPRYCRVVLANLGHSS